MECRICYNPAPPPLLMHTCDCRGSQEAIHSACLTACLRLSDSCGVCRKPYTIPPELLLKKQAPHISPVAVIFLESMVFDVLTWAFYMSAYHLLGTAYPVLLSRVLVGIQHITLFTFAYVVGPQVRYWWSCPDYRILWRSPIWLRHRRIFLPLPTLLWVLLSLWLPFALLLWPYRKLWEIHREFTRNRRLVVEEE